MNPKIRIKLEVGGLTPSEVTLIVQELKRNEFLEEVDYAMFFGNTIITYTGKATRFLLNYLEA